MGLAFYRNILNRYGLLACIQDVLISILNKAVFFRILLVYLKDQPVPENSIPVDIDIRILSDTDLSAHADRAGLELPGNFVHSARTNGDICIGAFVGSDLCAYAWYATSPPTFSDGVTALFDSHYAYAYKNLTLPSLRGRGVQKYIKEYALKHFRQLGKKGLLIAIDSLNHASSSSTRNSGSRLIGLWPYLKGHTWISGFTLGSTESGFRMVKATSAATDITIERISDTAALLTDHCPYGDWVQKMSNGQWLTYGPQWIKNIGPLYITTNKKLFFLLAYRDGRLIGVAPFMRESKPLSAMRLRRLYFWGGIQGTLNNMLGEFLIPNNDDLAPCIEAFRNYLYGGAKKDWDFMDLAYLPATSNSPPLLQSLLSPSRTSKESMQRFNIDFPGSFDTFCNALPRKPFSAIKRCRRKLSDIDATVEISEINTLNEALLDQLAELHNTRQDDHRSHGVARYSLFQHPRDSVAFRKLLQDKSDSGLTRHYLLKINGKIASFFLGFVAGDVYHLFLTAFDAQFSEYGPTKILLLEICKIEIERHGTRQITLSTGESRYKREFANTVSDNLHFEHRNNRLISKLKYGLYILLKKFRG